MIKKSILAAIFISFGVAANFMAPTPSGPFLFALGLLAVCYMDAYLFTGKCGCINPERDYKKYFISLVKILLINISTGWIMGRFLGFILPGAPEMAFSKVLLWMGSPEKYFLQSLCCGAIMFIAVEIFKRHKSPLGIIFGVPLFIFCGFQHSIANAITLGISGHLGPGHVGLILLAAIGNWLGSVGISSLYSRGG